MSQRLSLVDASFLRSETAATPQHAGGLSVFSGELTYADVLGVLRKRLPSVPLAVKRVQPVAFGVGRPVWADDPHFDLSYHLRHAALPAPGDDAQLGELLSRVIARPLDRSRPLWEMYVVDGLAGGRVGVFRKAHLAMTGGGRGDPFAILLDEAPTGRGGAGAATTHRRPSPAEATRGKPPATQPALIARAAAHRAGEALELGRRAGALATDPPRAVHAVASLAGAGARMGLRLLTRPPRSPLNVPLSPHRRFATAEAALEDLRGVRRAFGASLNDVVVTVVADSVGRLLRWWGHDTTDLDLRVMLPVSVHHQGSADGDAPRRVGDHVVGVLAPLPVMEIDPVARLYRVMGELAGLKESRQAVAADRLVHLAGFAPPNLHATAARLASAERRYNLALSNAPGPPAPRYLAGVRLEASYPFIPLAGDSALSVALSSYAGAVYFGVLGDREAVPDLDRMPRFLEEAVTALVTAAATR